MKSWFAIIVLLLSGCSAKAEKEPQALAVAAGCNAAAQACEAKGTGGVLGFSVPNARTMQPTAITVRWQGAHPAESVLVSFDMVDMAMGDNRYRLNADGQGGWSGKAMLPVCMKGRSDWIADVKVTEQGGAVYIARFAFTVQP